LLDSLLQERKIMTDPVKEKLRLSTPVLGFKFKVTRFTSFLSWTGMIFCVLMMIGSLALLTIPTDVEPFVNALRYELFTEGGLLGHARDGPRIFDIVCRVLAYTMYAYGGILLVLSLTFFPMYFLLRKRNMEKNQAGVMKMLKIICYVNAGIMIFFSILGIMVYTFNITQGFGLIGPMAGIIFYVLCLIFNSLKVHGIRTQNQKYVKAWIIFKYILLTLFTTAVIGVSIYGSAILSQFWIFLLSVLVVLWTSFLWIFYTGFAITLHTLMEHNLKGNYKVFDNNGFEDTVYKA